MCTVASYQRVGQPFECGPAYVFLASADASYFNGQVGSTVPSSTQLHSSPYFPIEPTLTAWTGCVRADR